MGCPVTEVALSRGSNTVGDLLPSPEERTDSVFETMCFQFFRIPDVEQSPRTQ
jgi:hypothetical protein